MEPKNNNNKEIVVITEQRSSPPPVLPISSVATNTPSKKKLTLLPLIFLIYFEVAGGPYGEEPVVKAAGPLLAIIGFAVFPLVWSVPEALVTAELSTAFPGNGGFVIWAERAFGAFWGSMMGTWKFLSVVINIAAFPAMCVDYLQRVFPVLGSGWARYAAIVAMNVALSLVNYTGVAVVGYVAVALAVASLSPFLVMSLIAIPKIKPRRWIAPLNNNNNNTRRDWSLYLNTLFWNLNFWDSVSTLAGEVENPRRTFPVALLASVVLTCLSYLVPLLAVLGSVEADSARWDTGFHAEAAAILAGDWLRVWIEVGAVLSAVGLFEAQLTSAAYQILGMAEIGVLPRLFGLRSKLFGTPLVGISLSAVVVLAFSCVDFTVIISAANFLYSLGMILEFASFVWLRRKMPALTRPIRVPLGTAGLVVMCLIPCGFLVFVMAIATRIVFLVSGALTVGAVGWFFLMRLFRSKRWLTFNVNAFDEE